MITCLCIIIIAKCKGGLQVQDTVTSHSVHAAWPQWAHGALDDTTALLQRAHQSNVLQRSHSVYKMTGSYGAPVVSPVTPLGRCVCAVSSPKAPCLSDHFEHAKRLSSIYIGICVRAALALWKYCIWRRRYNNKVFVTYLITYLL